MHFLFALGGAVLGGILLDGAYSPFGFLFGGVVGIGWSLLLEQRRELRKLREEVMALRALGPGAAAAAPPGPATDSASATIPVDPPAAAPAPAAAVTSAAQRTPYTRAATEPSELRVRLAEWGGRIVSFFTTGNLVVRLGVVVLFIGVAFLLRLAYEHALFPVELRLAGAALAGVVLMIVGWRFRERSDTYGLILQGAGIGVLYLTIFASARLYGLLPISVAFALLVVLIAGSCVLATVQRAQALATFAMSGGFLAPVLMSTDSGSHVALFSYYALLNTGILAMAYWRRWRWLNWVGFLFTFAIGASWGYRYYRPEFFATTEPFLLLFFFYYLGVSVLFARQQEVRLRGLVDGTLVFGTPIIAFALQAGLVRDMEFGLAYSALGAGVVYTGLALWLRRSGAFSSLLGQSFLALGVAFATLAIPFAFDNQRFTGAAWALEGAGLYWVGLRQAQRLPRVAGLLLQAAAAVAFVAEFGSPVDPALFLNSAYLGTVMLALAAGFVAYLVARTDLELMPFETHLRYLLLGWGVLWWLVGGLREIVRYRPSGYAQFEVSNLNEHLFLAFAAVSVAALTWFASSRRWREGLGAGMGLLPIGAGVLLWLDVTWQRATLLADLGWLAWPLLFVVGYWHLRSAAAFSRAASIGHALGWWLASIWLAWNLAALLHAAVGSSVWTLTAWGAGPFAVLGLLTTLRRRSDWPLADYPGAYFGWGWLTMAGYLLVWLVFSAASAGDPAPLPYVPLINPLELVQLGVLLLLASWIREPTQAGLRGPAYAVLGTIGFVWINSVAARGVHSFADVPYPLPGVVESDVFQAAASILWTCIALVLMGIGARRRIRVSWLVGAALLAMVVAKLFFVDLGKLDTVARIVSFISVGALMLVIGFFAPLPPAKAEEVRA